MQRFSLFFLLFLLGCSLSAQVIRENSPLSFFGIGDLAEQSFAKNRAMGSTAVAIRSPLNINPDNPASYTSLARTTFETAIFANGLWLNETNQNFGSFGGSLDYLALGFPIASFWGGSLGVRPFSSSNYNIVKMRTSEEVGDERLTFTGSGSWYEFYIGNGFRIGDFSLGFNLSYLFGTLNKVQTTEFLEAPGPLIELFQNRFTSSLNIGGLKYKLGFQYHKKLSDNLRLTVGLNGELKQKIRIRERYLYERLTLIPNLPGFQEIETFDSGENRVKLGVADSFGLGVMLNNGFNWSVTVEGEYKAWEQVDWGNLSGVPRNTLKLAAGTSFTPQVEARAGFFKLMDYRLGIYFKNHYLRIEDTDISEVGFSFGSGILLNRRKGSRLNFSFVIGQRTNGNTDLFNETFLRTTFGVSLNDRWFIKKKFD